MASSLKEEIRSAVKETLKEELSRAFSERKSTVEERTNDCKAETSKRTKSFEEFYKEREADRQKGFKPGKRKKKDPSSAYTATTNASKKVVDVEVKVGLATWSASEGSFKARRGKTHVVKVKSNAVRDDIIAEAVKKHASFDQSFDSIPPYVLVYPDFREVYFIPGTENVFVLSEYKQALCKESYKRLTFYLVQRDEFNDNSDDFCDSLSTDTSKPESKIPEQLFFSAQTRLDDYVQTTETSTRLEDYINTLPNKEGEHLIVKVKINTI